MIYQENLFTGTGQEVEASPADPLRLRYDDEELMSPFPYSAGSNLWGRILTPRLSPLSVEIKKFKNVTKYIVYGNLKLLG